ncbi:iron donor protein CyaY [Sulfuriferula sp. AH1]|uniref:iron donor protein CyaY n=1 Tax=Sulfuriferula sp. AH1 TaxID=1985873 RepID=UPI000B3B256C|nr:iron donor protein CyaY [Sulfuriferula sp. AH1]ARU30304.1 iron donor protein CyaY [Sulfuriferula sp. AH1]
MTETEFNQLTDETFRRIETALENADGDVDFELAAGNVLEIDCGPGGKIIVNRQAAMHEMWVAAKSGGFHYQWTDDAWRNSRDGTELLSSLARMIEQQGGGRVEFG